VRADVNAGVVEKLNHFAINGRIDIGIAGVGFARASGIGLAIFEPRLVDPGGAAAAAAVHKKFDAAGEKHAVAQGTRRLGIGLQLGKSFACGVHIAAAVEQSENAHRGFVVVEKLAIESPARRFDAGILGGGHAFGVEVGHHFEQAVALLVVGVIGDELADRLHSGFFEDAGGGAVGRAIDSASVGIFGVAGDFG